MLLSRSATTFFFSFNFFLPMGACLIRNSHSYLLFGITSGEMFLKWSITVCGALKIIQFPHKAELLLILVSRFSYW